MGMNYYNVPATVKENESIRKIHPRHEEARHLPSK